MLKQMLRQNPIILPYLYDECLESRTVTPSSSQQCSKLLGTVLQAVPRTSIIVDGIDACEEHERNKILQFFSSVIDKSSTESGNLRCLFISQELDDMKEALGKADILRLTDQHSEQDIRHYAMMQSIAIQEKFGITEAAREHIFKVVCARAKGTFLSADIFLAKLYRESTLDGLSNELGPDSFTPEMLTARVYARYRVTRGLDARSLAATLGNSEDLPEIDNTWIGLPSSREVINTGSCPTVASRDSGYASRTSQVVAQEKTREKSFYENTDEWESRSVASLESQATDITMSSVNPAGTGGAAEQLAEVLLLNNDIRTLLDEGFHSMESDRFERNFRRLLKDYASSLRIEAKDALEKGATKIVHTYRAYVTRIIRSKIVGSESEFQALAFHEIKSQETSKVTLERFLEQYQAPTDEKGSEESRENLESETGSKFSDDEQPYLPNLEKVTDFLVSSAAFHAFKEALCTFVRPTPGARTSSAHLANSLTNDVDHFTRMDVDLSAAPNLDKVSSEAPKKRILELDNSIEPCSKWLEAEQMENEICADDRNSNEKRQQSLEEGDAQVEADIEMIHTKGGGSLLPCSATSFPISNQEIAEKIDESNQSDALDQNSECSPEISEHSNRIMPSQSPTVGLPPRFSIPSSEDRLDSDASQMRKQGLKNNRQSHEKRHRQADVEPVPAARHSISDEGPPVFQEQPNVQKLKLNVQSRVKNTIKKLLRPPVSADFERIEWICVSLSQVTFETNL
jgi:hypothetical protein